MDLLEAREIMGFVRSDGDPKEPYGDVAYADPGYIDGKKRYPIDTKAHSKSAWSYFHMPKNQEGYTASQVNLIMGRIKAACEKFGVEIDDSKADDPDDDEDTMGERSKGDGAGDGGVKNLTADQRAMLGVIHDHVAKLLGGCPEML